jgi:hypothetical protein
MIKMTIAFSVLLLLLFIKCTDKEIRQVDLKGDLYVNINTYSEVMSVVNDRDSIELTLGGTDLERKVYTDSSGSYTFKDLSMGVYSLVVAKDGYAGFKKSNLQFIGNDVTDTILLQIMHKSTTKVKKYSLGLNGDTLIFKGSITHNYKIPVCDCYPHGWPWLWVFMSDSSNVSYTNYRYPFPFYSDENADTIFSTYCLIDYSRFPSGSTIYTIIYGQNVGFLNDYYSRPGFYDDYTFGDPSEVKSIVVP